jgi:hypothetical protein
LQHVRRDDTAQAVTDEVNFSSGQTLGKARQALGIRIEPVSYSAETKQAWWETCAREAPAEQRRLVAGQPQTMHDDNGLAAVFAAVCA